MGKDVLKVFGKRLTALLLVLGVLMCGTALARQGDEFTFVYARSGSVTSLNLHQEITANNAFAIDKIFEPLVMFDENGDIYDCLAREHTISEDGKVYTFTLRDGLLFSDGTPVTAEDVVFSLKRHIEVQGPLPLQAPIESVAAQDEKTVVVTLSEAYTPFIAELAGFSNGILPADFGGKTEEEFFSAPVGTGPFVVESWDKAGDIVFVKNPYYWREGEPAIDRLVYKLVDDDNQAVNQLRVGDVDAVESLSYAMAAAMEGQAETDVITRGGWNVEEIFFNTLDEHFSDVHVRRALALAIDRQALTQALTFGYGEKADSVLPENLRYNAGADTGALGYDLDAAREEMALSAFPDGFSTSISIPAGNNVRLQEALIVQRAGSEIGIDIAVNQQESATFRADFRALNFSMMINTAIADFPDADSIFAFQVDPEGFSQCFWTSYFNPEAVRLMKEGRVAADGEARQELYTALQQILAQDVPYIPLYYSGIVAGVRADVEGLVMLPNGSADLRKVRRKSGE